MRNSEGKSKLDHASRKLTSVPSSGSGISDHGGTLGEDAGRAQAKRFPLVGVLLLVMAGWALLRLAEVKAPLARELQNNDALVTYESKPAVDLLDPSIGTRSSTSLFLRNDLEFNLSVDSPTLEMGSELDAPRGRAHLLRVQGPGRCWNPHPGPFRSWQGQQNGCILQVWRQFQDGCTHFQWYNSCNGIWDPQIYWTYCIH